MAAYSEKRKREVLKLYEAHGTREAARRSGVNPATITRWASAAGVRTKVAQKGRESAEALMASCAEQRARMVPVMVKAFHDVMDRIYEPHQEFVGQHGKEVTYEKAPAGAVKSYVIAAATLLDKIRLEEGQVTDRTEQLTVNDFDREVRELTEKVRHVEPEHSSNGVG